MRHIGLLALVLVGLALAVPGAPTYAQSVRVEDARCARLKSQLAGLDASAASEPRQASRYQQAIDRQSDELQRTVDYAQSVGCDVDPVGQCRALAQNIRRMERNLEALQAQAQRLSDEAGSQRDGERERLAAVIQDLDCDGTARSPRPPRSAGLFEQLFGPDETDAYPMPPSTAPAPADEAMAPAVGGANLRTICVRKCDGFFFPISFSTNAASFPADAESCQKQCPTAEVELFAYDTFTQQPEDAVSTRTGEPLKSLPNAFKFRSAYVESCTCKGAAVPQTKASAGDALKRLDDEALSLPEPGKAEAPKPSPAPKTATASPPAPGSTAASPTSKSLPVTSGTQVETTGPGGEKKKVRIVGPSVAPAP